MAILQDILQPLVKPILEDVFGGGEDLIPSNALLDREGNPILDREGNYILESERT